MSSKESEAVKRHWATLRQTSQLPVAEQPDRETADHAWAARLAGLAASLASAGRQTGTTLGVAIAGTILGTTASQGAQAFTTAEHPIWWTTLALGLAILLLTHLTHRQAGEAVV